MKALPDELSLAFLMGQSIPAGQFPRGCQLPTELHSKCALGKVYSRIMGLADRDLKAFDFCKFWTTARPYCSVLRER